MSFYEKKVVVELGSTAKSTTAIQFAASHVLTPHLLKRSDLWPVEKRGIDPQSVRWPRIHNTDCCSVLPTYLGTHSHIPLDRAKDLSLAATAKALPSAPKYASISVQFKHCTAFARLAFIP